MDRGRASGKDRFVVEECVNSGTREITMLGCGMEVASICFDTKLALKRRFPNQNWVNRGRSNYVKYCREDEDIDDEKEA